MKLGLMNNDDAIRALENSLLDLESVTPEVERQLVESAAKEGDDYLREQLYRSLCTMYLRQGRIAQFEDIVGDWRGRAALSFHTALWMAQLLRQAERPLLALEVLLPFANSDWRIRAGSAQLRWIELVVHVLRDLDDIFTAVDVCEKIVALDANLESSQSWLTDTDMTGAASFYGFLADAFLAFSRISAGSTRQVIEYTERQKAAFFSRGLESSVPEFLSKEQRDMYRALVVRLAVLEEASGRNYRHALAAVPFPGRLTRGANLSMLDSHTIVATKDLIAEREREREMESVRRELLTLRAAWPPQSSPWSSIVIGHESVYEQIAKIGVVSPTTSLIYRIDRLEEAVLIFVVNSVGEHKRFVSDVSIASLDALVFMLDQYPAHEFAYIASGLSEMLLPPDLSEHLSRLDVT